jgi:2-dehydro-3-deoxyphosphogluconate aldolase/(4S)-4-hydroxy-2-oxoglutarate aldolase
MDKEAILRRMHADWLVMILRGDSARQTEEAFDAIVEGGGTLLEVPFTTPDACAAIANLRRRHGDRVIVSAGTVTHPDQARQAIESGAQAIVSPNVYPAVVEVAVEQGVISMPGCFTPSEVADALRLGADVIKLFPCNPVGPEYLGYLLGPFPGTRIAPAGSIVLENMKAYYDAGAFAGVAGVMTEMRLADAVRAGRFDEITACTRHWIEQVQRMRS